MDKAGDIFSETTEAEAEPNAGPEGTKFVSWAQFTADSPCGSGCLTCSFNAFVS